MGRFLRTYESVSASLEALTRSRQAMDAPGGLLRPPLARLESLDRLRLREAARAWSLDLDPQTKSALQVVLLRQCMAIDRLRAVLQAVPGGVERVILRM